MDARAVQVSLRGLEQLEALILSRVGLFWSSQF